MMVTHNSLKVVLGSHHQCHLWGKYIEAVINGFGIESQVLGSKIKTSPYPIAYYFVIIRHDSTLNVFNNAGEGSELNATSAQLRRQGVGGGGGLT
jgi:hypothetical protein